MVYSFCRKGSLIKITTVGLSGLKSILSHLLRYFGNSWYFICCRNGEIRNVRYQSWPKLWLYWVSGSFQKNKLLINLSFQLLSITYRTSIWIIPKRFLISYLIFLVIILFMQYYGLSILYWTNQMMTTTVSTYIFAEFVLLY